MTPTAPGERVLALDVVRGAALLGVLLINLETLFRQSLFTHILSGQRGWLEWIFEFKSMDLFCLCFGAGLAIQSDRPVSFLARRFGVLLLFGLIHLFLIWNGDILTLYALCGLVLIPLVRLPAWTMAVLGVAISFLQMGWFLPTDAAMRAQASSASVYGTGGFIAILRFRSDEAVRFIVPLLIATIPHTLSLMLIGGSVWKAQVRWPIVLGAALAIRGDVAQALAYGVVLVLAARQLRWIAPLGRMALTNYLTQTLVLTVLFYGFGFGLFGRIGEGTGIAIGAGLYVLQVAFSHWWLKRYRFGPMEWLWRSLSYGIRQPMYNR